MEKTSFDPLNQDSWPDDLKEYFDYVDECLKNGTIAELTNGSAIHAYLFILKFIKNGKKDIKIVSRKLKKQSDQDKQVKFWADEHVLNAIEDFLTNGKTNLEIILTEKVRDIVKHPLIKTVKKLQKNKSLTGRLSVKDLSGSKTGLERFTLSGSTGPINFITMDNHASRVEIHHKQVNAFVDLGNKEIVRDLRELFELNTQVAKELITIEPTV